MWFFSFNRIVYKIHGGNLILDENCTSAYRLHACLRSHGRSLKLSNSNIPMYPSRRTLAMQLARFVSPSSPLPPKAPTSHHLTRNKQRKQGQSSVSSSTSPTKKSPQCWVSPKDTGKTQKKLMATRGTQRIWRGGGSWPGLGFRRIDTC